VREGAPARPDGILMVDADGIVRYTDRGARDLFGAGLEGRNLGRLAPASGLEAFVRDARTEAREGFRFDLPARNSRAARALSAGVVPLITAPGSKDPELRVVLLCDLGRRRVANELIRLQDYVLPRRELGVLLDAARSAFGPATIVGASGAAARVRSQVAEAARSTQPVLILESPAPARSTSRARCTSRATSAARSCPSAAPASRPRAWRPSCSARARRIRRRALRPARTVPAGAHGTIFLEDVDQLPQHLQEKLLRALREGKVTRAGSERAEPSEVRVVASSSVDLSSKVREGRSTPSSRRALQGRHPDPRAARAARGRAAARQALPGALRRRLPSMEVSTRPCGRWRTTSGRATCASSRRACAAPARRPPRAGDRDRAPAGRAGRAGRALPSRDLVPTPPPARVALGSEHSGAQPGSAPPRLDLGAPSGERGAARKPWEIAPDDPPSLELYEMKALLHALDRTGGDKLAAARL
jgi:hypothetical protein